ncbi:putative leucine-rich repeat domain superfamily [Helianthus anomalus]
MTPNLEELYLEECNDFVELHMPVVCPKLKYLNLSGSRLSNFNLGMTPNLEELYLKECNDFVQLNISEECPKPKVFNLGCSKASNLNLGLTPLLEKSECLEKLTLSVKDITHLPDSICIFKHLKYIELESCWFLEQLPKDFDRLECLEELRIVDCTSLRDIPNSISNMKCLKCLHLPHCILVKKLPEELGHLHCLKELNIEGTGITHLPQSIFQLKGLCIVWSRGRLELHGFTSLNIISEYTASCYI